MLFELPTQLADPGSRTLVLVIPVCVAQERNRERTAPAILFTPNAHRSRIGGRPGGPPPVALDERSLSPPSGPGWRRRILTQSSSSSAATRTMSSRLSQRKANQTRQLVAPLARSLGLAGIAAELDALATRTLGNPITRLDPTVHAHTQHAPDAGIRAAHSLLRAAARVLLPGQCRERWLAEWDGELHALPSRRHRLAFIADLLLGLPSMALHARHTRQIHDGDDQ